MSLQVWLPLDGNLNSQGILNCTTIASNAVVNNNGKIGKCYSFASNQKIDFTLPTSITSSIGTLAYWVKFDSLPSSGSWYCLMQIGTAGGFANCVFGSYIWNNSGTIVLQLSLNGSSGSSTPNNNFNYSFQTNKWYHIAQTYDGTSAKHYINGELVSTIASAAKNSYTTGSHLFLGGTSSYYLNGCLNDCRYYNNVLSAKEIKEISKGLVLHWPLCGAPKLNWDKHPLRLPNEYQEVEYLENTGNQYINTGLVPKRPLVLNAVMAWSDRTETGEKDFWGNFGALNSQPSSACFVVGRTAVTTWYQWAGGSFTPTGTMDVGNPLYTSFTYTTSGRTANINGQITTAAAGNDFTTYTSNTIGLFSGSGNRKYCMPKVKIWKASIIQEGKLERNFIPCYRKSDFEPGMYDLVYGVFYPNVGTDKFIIGPVVKNLPDTYLACESIRLANCSFNPNLDGGTLNTGWHIRSRWKFNTFNSSWGGLFGTESLSGNSSACRNWLMTNKNGVYIGIGSSYQNKVTLLQNTENDLDCEINGTTGTLWQNGKLIGTYTNSGSKGNSAYRIGAIGTPGDNTGYQQSSADLYYMLILDKDKKPLRNFKPAIRKSDNVVGLYDLINDIFYTAISGTPIVSSWQHNREYDISGYHRDGLTNNRNLSLQAYLGNQRYPKKYYFNGSNDQLCSEAGSFSWFDFSSATLCGWLKPHNTPSGWTGTCGVQADVGNGSSKSFGFSNYAGKFTAHLNNGSYDTSHQTSALTVDQWYFCTLTISGTTLKMYLNSELVNTYTINWNSATVHANTLFACGVDLPGSDERLNGYMSDIRLYSTVLTETEIKELYDMGRLN